MWGRAAWNRSRDQRIAPGGYGNTSECITMDLGGARLGGVQWGGVGRGHACADVGNPAPEAQTTEHHSSQMSCPTCTKADLPHGRVPTLDRLVPSTMPSAMT